MNENIVILDFGSQYDLRARSLPLTRGHAVRKGGESAE